MIKAIVFDLDGVYFPESGKKGFETRLKKKYPAKKIENLLYKSEEMRYLVRGEWSSKEFVDWVNEYLGSDYTVESFGKDWTADYEVNHDVKKYIRSVREAGYISCTVSNNNEIRVNALQEKFEFLDDFDTWVFSYEVGDFKPNEKIFKALVYQTGLEPEEIIMSDDVPEKLQGAKKLGITTVVFKDFKSFKKELNKLGVKV